MAIILTPTAANEVKKIIEAQKLDSSIVLRIVITGAGCSGLGYSLGFDTQYDPTVDAVYDNHGIRIVARKTFDLFLDGMSIDFIDTPMSSGFSLDNPYFPAGAGCAGCGGH